MNGLAVDFSGGKNWSWDYGDLADRCQWCVGPPGVGFVYAAAEQFLDETSYLAMVETAGEATYLYGDGRNNPCQCHGLTGGADLLFELYRRTSDPMWLERGADFVERILAYRRPAAAGDFWQADRPGVASPEFMNGASGVGHFLLRLLSPGLRMPLL